MIDILDHNKQGQWDKGRCYRQQERFGASSYGPEHHPIPQAQWNGQVGIYRHNR